MIRAPNLSTYKVSPIWLDLDEKQSPIKIPLVAMSPPKAKEAEQGRVRLHPFLEQPSACRRGSYSRQQQRTRVRNNQWDTRAKRQAYLTELEMKWSDCVKHGAQANADIQQATGRVKRENDFLKALLQERGLEDEALKSRIQQFRQARPDHPTRKVEAPPSPSCGQARSGPLSQVSQMASPMAGTAPMRLAL